MQGTLTTNQSSTKHRFSTIIPLSNAYKPICWWLNPNEPSKITPILSHSSTAPYKNQSRRFFMAPNNPSCCGHPVWDPDMASTRSAASEAKWLAFLVPGTWRSWGSQCDKLGKLSGHRTDIYIYTHIYICMYIIMDFERKIYRTFITSWYIYNQHGMIRDQPALVWTWGFSINFWQLWHGRWWLTSSFGRSR